MIDDHYYFGNEIGLFNFDQKISKVGTGNKIDLFGNWMGP